MLYDYKTRDVAFASWQASANKQVCKMLEAYKHTIARAHTQERTHNPRKRYCFITPPVVSH